MKDKKQVSGDNRNSMTPEHFYTLMGPFYDNHMLNRSREKIDIGSETVFLRDILGQRRRVLDIGCGTGIISEGLESEGYDVFGNDVAYGMLVHARKRIKKVVVADQFMIPYTSGSFDAVISIRNGFSYCPSEEFCLTLCNEAYRVLSDEGIAVFDSSSPHKFIDKEPRLEWNAGNKRINLAFYIYDIKSLVRIMHEAAFVGIEVFGSNKKEERAKKSSNRLVMVGHK